MSYPGYKLEQIIQFETFDISPLTIIIAGTNDQLLLSELLNLYDNIADTYTSTKFIFVLPFNLYNKTKGNLITVDKYKIIQFNPLLNDYQDDGVHLNQHGQEKFTDYILEIISDI